MSFDNLKTRIWVFAITLLGLAAFGSVSYAVIPLPEAGLRVIDARAVVSAITKDDQIGYSVGLSASNAASQANCTAIVNPISFFSTVVATGSVCLPKAYGGQSIRIANQGAAAMSIYGSNSPNVAGTQDTINGTTGSTAFTAVTAGKMAMCVSVPGKWQCLVN